MATKTPTCKYTIGDIVEILSPAYDKPGAPWEWTRSVVTAVLPDARFWTVRVAFETRRPVSGASFTQEMVGLRGGNKRIRQHAENIARPGRITCPVCAGMRIHKLLNEDGTRGDVVDCVDCSDGTIAAS